jgi:PBSX family phage portal protein
MAKSKVVEIPVQANRSGNRANRSALQTIRARVIEVRKQNGLTDSTAEPGKSEVAPDDPFHELIGSGNVVEPPFDMLTLAMLAEHNTELGQCVDAMEVNIAGTGHRFPSRLRLDDITPADEQTAQTATEARQAKVRLLNFFQDATRESFTAFRRRLQRDQEQTGNAYFEVIRNAADDIQGFTHIPAYQVRLGRMDEEARKVKRKILELQADGSVQIKEQEEWRRFRKYVQSRTVHRHTLTAIQGHKAVWFKEFGDQRQMDKNTGEFKDVPVKKRATELIQLKIYSPRTPYGLPRYIGNLLSIFGDRAAEEINYITFRNNNIPSMILLVSNGQLTQGTIERIQSFVDSQIQGSDNYSKFLIVEGEPFGEEGEDGGQVKVDARPLTAQQHKDALFQNYSENNQDKIRRAFRLPPIFVGRSDDYTRATAESSRRLADEQIFNPERSEFDNMMNRLIFPEMGIQFHKYKSNSPNTTDNAQLVKILAGAEKTGGMTPRIARSMLEDILGIDLPPMPKDFPADTPFSLTMAEAVKNKADTSEPGQSVTAIKALKELGIIGDDGDLELGVDVEKGELEDSEVASVAAKLLVLNRSVEKLWRVQQDLEE